MVSEKQFIDMNICRICMTNKRPLCPLFRYKWTGNYAEMLTAIADVKVACDDGLPDKICNKCCGALERAFYVKTVAESTDRKLRQRLEKATEQKVSKKIAFDSLADIKSEISPLIKAEPCWEMEIYDLNKSTSAPMETIDGKDIVIASTVIKKVYKDQTIKVERQSENIDNTQDTDWKISTVISKTDDNEEVEYLDDDIFQDDVDDEDYVPPTEKSKNKFKKPKLSEIKVFKDKKTVLRKYKVVRAVKENFDELAGNSDADGRRAKSSTMITCYPIMKNGSRGPPILLRRPKDATVLKIHPNYKSKSVNTYEGSKIIHRDKAVRLVRPIKPIMKPKEKLVCPVCGILTHTLGNHIATHEDKKKYSCTECTKTFSQKSNLSTHMKFHAGIKDCICEICGAAFYNQKSLVRHNLIHKGERPYPCTLCNKKFIARCDLTRHLRIHSGYKPYKCNMCTMSFNAKHQLQNHERMHTGERPYTCQVCDVAFSYKVNLNNHVSKVHGICLKFKSIHTVTEEIIRKEMSNASETRVAISHIMPHLTSTTAADESVPHISADYSL